MTLLLLRHAHAGDRDRWEGDDRVRPLDDRGVHQARALVEAYAGRRIERILASPWTRCVQTVEPLAAALHLDVEVEDTLGEGTPLDVAQRLLRRVHDDAAVLCTHGDVIAAVVTDLAHREVVRSDALRWQKGSTWVLDGIDPSGRPDDATYLPPPA